MKNDQNEEVREFFVTDIEKGKLKNYKQNMKIPSRSMDLLSKDRKEILESIKKPTISNEEQKDLVINQSSIKLKKYIKPIIEKYFSKVEKFKKKQLRLGLGYIPINSPSLLKAYDNREKCDWVGIIYKITEILVVNNRKFGGRMLYGYTTDTLDLRWERYKKHAYNDFMENQKIHNAILKIQMRGKNPDNYFIRKIIEVHFDDILMRKRERFWIAKDKTQDPKIGFNINKGGEGGSKIKISMKALIKFLARGYNESQISRIISHRMNYTISKSTIRRRINGYWGNYRKARKMFLKPILKGLIIDGYRPKNIIKAFGKRGRNIVEILVPLYFNGMTFLEVRRNYLLNKLKKIIPYANIEKKVFTQLKKFGRVEIINIINKTWGGFHKAQKKLRQPIAIELLRANLGGQAIFSNFGYSDSVAYSNHNGLMQKLFGLNTELGRCFFTSYYKGSPNKYTQIIKLTCSSIIFFRAKSLLVKNRDHHYSGSHFIRDLGRLGYAPITIKRNSNKILKKVFGMNFIELKNYIHNNILPSNLEMKRSFYEKNFNG